MAMTDEQAMWRVQTQNDHRAFAELVDRWDEPVLTIRAKKSDVDAFATGKTKFEDFAKKASVHACRAASRTTGAKAGEHRLTDPSGARSAAGEDYFPVGFPPLTPV